MITRKEYMIGACTHREYYAQFVNHRTRYLVAQHIGAERIKASTHPHFSDIPLSEWDRLTPCAAGSAQFEKAGDYYTVAGGVCMLKEAAEQIREGGQA